MGNILSDGKAAGSVNSSAVATGTSLATDGDATTSDSLSSTTQFMPNDSGSTITTDNPETIASNSDDLNNRQSDPSLSDTSMSNNSTAAADATSTTNNFKLNLFGTDYYPFRWLTLPTLVSWLGPISSVAMIVGCVMPYVPQYWTIHQANDSKGFSTFVCLTLLIANILRVAWWFGSPFELPLLIQSIVMIIAQLLLLELCVRTRRRSLGPSYEKKRLFSCKFGCFWRWTNLSSYIEFLCLFTAVTGTVMYFLIDCKPFVEAVGYCALVIESMLGLPQVIRNYRKKSVQGMSLSMVLMWMAGDSFKTGYFIANNTPFQFWLCGLLQISIDLLILFQVCLFKQNAPTKKLYVDTMAL